MSIIERVKNGECQYISEKRQLIENAKCLSFAYGFDDRSAVPFTQNLYVGTLLCLATTSFYRNKSLIISHLPPPPPQKISCYFPDFQ
jgi:hypothetical protein